MSRHASRSLWAVVIGAVLLAGCTTYPSGHVPPEQRYAGVPLPAPTPTVPPGMQYLYGSGEAAALSRQTWRTLTDYVGDQVAHRPADTVVLDTRATLAAPTFLPCGNKPLAAVFDVDETVLLNLGYEYDDAAHPRPFDDARWQEWERTGVAKVSPVPGAVEALAAIRKLGVTVVFNTNRSAANAAETAAAITGAGLGPAVHGETLFLSGDDAMGSKKDGRRTTIAAKYCVVAMGGDQLGDFSDLFNAGLTPGARRTAVQSPAIARLWGNGWFVLPNPVYGSALKGGFDDVFPTDKRWAPAPQEK